MQDGVAIIGAGTPSRRNGDVEFKFRPGSDFYYLTGFAEPGAVLVLSPRSESERTVLFVPPRNPEREIWNGRRAGLLGAIERFGADAAYPSHDLDERLPRLLQNQETVYHALGHDAELDRHVIGALNRLRGRTRDGVFAPSRVVDPGVLLHEMRLVKQAVELELLRQAARITGRAHAAAMSFARPGRTEFEVEALVDYTFRNQGAVGPGYATIVAAGPNATTLHYTQNRSVLRNGDLVLIDAGAEYELYTADVTRTFPANGTFSAPQRELYDVVLAAQEESIAMAVPGARLDAIHRHAVRVLTTGLVRLGLLQGTVDDLVRDRAFRRFYMHRTSHWLGMDVHDAGAYQAGGESRALTPGMVLTVEPGLYVEAGAAGVDPRYHGIGIRIEDDVLVTTGAPEVLTAEIPKAAADIEAACRAPASPVPGARTL